MENHATLNTHCHISTSHSFEKLSQSGFALAMTLSLEEADRALDCWVGLLKPGGRLILMKCYWNTGSGLHASEIEALLPHGVKPVSIQDLSGQPDLWGMPIGDERYAIIADRID